MWRHIGGSCCVQPNITGPQLFLLSRCLWESRSSLAAKSIYVYRPIINTISRTLLMPYWWPIVSANVVVVALLIEPQFSRRPISFDSQRRNTWTYGYLDARQSPVLCLSSTHSLSSDADRSSTSTRDDAPNHSSSSSSSNSIVVRSGIGVRHTSSTRWSNWPQWRNKKPALTIMPRPTPAMAPDCWLNDIILHHLTPKFVVNNGNGSAHPRVVCMSVCMWYIASFGVMVNKDNTLY